jgi:hypothetical protein
VKYACCQAPDCGSTALTAHPVETWDAAAQLWVGEQRCDVCGASVLYRRKPNQQKQTRDCAAGDLLADTEALK